MMNFSGATVVNSTDIGEQHWKHFLRNNSPSVVTKLSFIGLFYFLVGILSIGLDIGLLINAWLGFGAGIVNGGFLIMIGILTMILCRQQVYVLTSLFIVAYFQLFVSICAFIGYAIFYSIYNSDRSSYCSRYLFDCGPIQSILIASLVHIGITFFVVIANMVVITNARRPPFTLAQPAYVVYDPRTQPMPVSFQNPVVTPLN